jgi:hypothetical protein
VNFWYSLDPMRLPERCFAVDVCFPNLCFVNVAVLQTPLAVCDGCEVAYGHCHDTVVSMALCPTRSV